MIEELFDISDWRKIFSKLRLIELAILIIIGSVFLSNGSNSGRPQFIPQYDKSNQSYISNTLFSYPIVLSKSKCLPERLSICLSNPSYVHDCCTSARNKNQVPYETVSSNLLVLFAVGLPVIVISLRSVAWRLYYRSFYQSPTTNFYWILTAWDSLIGLGYALLYAVMITDTLKLYVQAPRPNFNSLKLYVEFIPSDREYYDSDASKSFPSGHSSLSMAGLGFITLLMLADAFSISLKHPLTARFLGHMSMLAVLLSIYTGATRIADFYHFAHDVAVGWMIGGLSAVFAVLFLAGSGLSVGAKLIELDLSLQSAEKARHSEQFLGPPTSEV